MKLKPTEPAKNNRNVYRKAMKGITSPRKLRRLGKLSAEAKAKECRRWSIHNVTDESKKLNILGGLTPRQH